MLQDAESDRINEAMKNGYKMESTEERESKLVLTDEQKQNQAMISGFLASDAENKIEQTDTMLKDFFGIKDENDSMYKKTLEEMIS